jgi:hypothetical protein
MLFETFRTDSSVSPDITTLYELPRRVGMPAARSSLRKLVLPLLGVGNRVWWCRLFNEHRHGHVIAAQRCSQCLARGAASSYALLMASTQSSLGRPDGRFELSGEVAR